MTVENEHLEKIEQIYAEIKKSVKGKPRAGIEYALAVSIWLNELLKKEIPKARFEALRQGQMAAYLDQWTVIKRDEKRQAGTKKERKPHINSWILKQLKSDPDLKSQELWCNAPGEIGDSITIHAFKKRITKVRKK